MSTTFKPINSVPKSTTTPNAIQVKQVEPVALVAVDATVQGVATGRAVALNVNPVHIGLEIQKENNAMLETLYSEEKKHLGTLN